MRRCDNPGPSPISPQPTPVLDRGSRFQSDVWEGVVEDLNGTVVQLLKSAKYAQVLKNYVAFKEVANERRFLMKDLAAVEGRWA